MKIKILFVAHDSTLYGANQSLLNMISSLRDKDLESIVVFPDNGPICLELDKLQLKYYIIKYRNENCDDNGGVKKYALNILRYYYKIIFNSLALIKLNKINKIHGFNIVHSNSSVVAIGEEFARRNNIRHIWHLREYIDLDHGLSIFGGIDKYKIRLQKSDQIICITKGVALHFGVQNKAFIIHDAVRRTYCCIPNKERRKYFLFCGSLHKGKGIEDAINAFYQIPIQNHDCSLLIAGTGEAEYEIYLKRMVSEMKMQEKIKFLGFRQDTDALMSNALAFLMCSKNEALGRVTPEAMLNFCPVIGFNNAGTSEIVEDGVTGFLYENIDQLTNYMKCIINNQLDIEQVRLNAFNYAKNVFLEEQYGNKIMKLYCDLVC